MSELLATVVHDSGEEELERSLRPRTLDDFVGQARVKEQLACLHPGIKRFVNPHLYPVGLERRLHERKTELVLEARGLITPAHAGEPS